LLSDTKIKTKFQREGTQVFVNMTTILNLPDSVSIVCGDYRDGVKFCNFSRKPVVIDAEGIEMDL
jgi:hypothetical protein